MPLRKRSASYPPYFTHVAAAADDDAVLTERMAPIRRGEAADEQPERVAQTMGDIPNVAGGLNQPSQEEQPALQHPTGSTDNPTAALQDPSASATNPSVAAGSNMGAQRSPARQPQSQSQQPQSQSQRPNQQQSLSASGRPNPRRKRPEEPSLPYPICSHCNIARPIHLYSHADRRYCLYCTSPLDWGGPDREWRWCLKGRHQAPRPAFVQDGVEHASCNICNANIWDEREHSRSRDRNEESGRSGRRRRNRGGGSGSGSENKGKCTVL